MSVSYLVGFLCLSFSKTGKVNQLENQPVRPLIHRKAKELELTSV